MKKGYYVVDPQREKSSAWATTVLLLTGTLLGSLLTAGLWVLLQ